jgi:hypothetical protein
VNPIDRARKLLSDDNLDGWERIRLHRAIALPALELAAHCGACETDHTPCGHCPCCRFMAALEAALKEIEQ